VYAAGNAWAIDANALMTGLTPAEDKFEPLTWALYQMGCQLNAPTYLMAVTALQLATRLITALFMPYDAVLTPTITEPPVPLGTFDSPPDNPLYGLMRAAPYVPFTTIGNFTGLPAMSMPLYWNDDGLPIGTMFYGRFGDEATLFRLAAQLEEARPWAGRRPPVSA
jgi:amidase